MTNHIPDDTGTGPAQTDESAIITVLRGSPNADEVAALLVALASVRARDAAEADRDADGAARRLARPQWDRPRHAAYRSPTSWLRAA